MQLLYETSLCLWFLTFHPPALAAMRRGAFAEGLMDVAKLATKEKVARVAVLAPGTSPRARRRANNRTLQTATRGERRGSAARTRARV